MRPLILLLSVLALPASGCLQRQVRAAAAATLECPAHSLTVEEKNRRVYWVTGCGRGAVCEKPDEPGAEVGCAGGAALPDAARGD
jgi:hypothetical protein